MIGTTLSGYRVVEQIGAGGMATVYKAYDPSTDRYVALKILPEHYSHDPRFRERFNREAKAIARLEHPHILPVHAYGEENGIAYLVMRYVETGTLSERLLQGRLSLKAALQLVRQVAAALDYAHEHGILHRDVKPSNILLDKKGNAYLTDFGIAKIVEATLDLTGGGILGTPKYMSPEQCRGGPDLTQATDQYSLGIVLYEIVTGQVPFDAETPMAVIYKHLHDPLPLPRSVQPDLPEGVERVLLKALAKDPEARYPTCTAMADAFQQAASEAPTQLSMPTTALDPALLNQEAHTIPYAPPETMPVPPERAKRRPPSWLFGALIGLGIIAVVVAGVLRLRPGASEEAQAPTVPQEPSAVPQERTRYSWEFNTGFAEGWGEVNPSGLDRLMVQDGLLMMHLTNDDPFFFSPPDLLIDATLVPKIEIRMRLSPDAAASSCIYFITRSDSEFDESKVLCVDYPPGEEGQFRSLIFEMSSLNTWRGVVTQLRFDPPEYLANTFIEIDYIRVFSGE